MLYFIFAEKNGCFEKGLSILIILHASKNMTSSFSFDIENLENNVMLGLKRENTQLIIIMSIMKI